MNKISLKIDNFQQTLDIPKTEEKVLDFWDSIDAFQKSIDLRPADKPYVFYDGPPFATGLPHYGHLLGSIMKDIVPRYWTMKGYRVERVWGWDCHGIPIENMIEKELGLKGGKKGIEEMGIDKFNAACRAAILRFDKDWEVIIRRIGRWVDFKNSYKTMDTTFMESVWWAFKSLYEKGLVYQGRKVILYCPRCSSPLSNFEIAMDNSYKDLEDFSIFVKFKIKGSKNESILAWTTTPWTLIGNVGLAIDPNATYVKVKQGDEVYYLIKTRLEILVGEYVIEKELSGKELVDLEYERLYTYLPVDKKAFFVMPADFVSLEDGTGIVHTAAMYGEDDYRLALEHELPLVDMLDDQGKFMGFVKPLEGTFYKKAESWIVEDLEARGLLYRQEKITHSYPFCYRCETPLYYNAIPAWFINIAKIKPKLIDANEQINWFPAHLKKGRFGKGLETAPDWNISRSRYWGTPMPIWTENRKQKTENNEQKRMLRIIGSIEELKEWAVEPKLVENITDIHRESIDHIEVWVDDEKTIKGQRIKEVFDCWIESGSMPFASEHYPFENKDRFSNRHPAQYITEYIAQTRAWFYTLHVMSVGLFDKPTFENALTTGTIMAEDGSKMSKSKKNFTDPMLLVDKYGVDSLRMYFASSPLMKTAENVNFSETSVSDIKRRTFNILWNVIVFYKMFCSKNISYEYPNKLDQIMDKWLVSQAEDLILIVTKAMDEYDVVTASRSLMEFVNELSTWYLRRSRDRLRQNENDSQRVFGAVLYRLSLLLAPFAPFFAELMYQNLKSDGSENSVHHELWPVVNKNLIDSNLDKMMDELRLAAEKVHAIRKEKGLALRQPLGKLVVQSSIGELGGELLTVLADELNVKIVEWSKGETLQVELDTLITDDLKAEGEARVLIRAIQQARKEAGTRLDETVAIELPDWPVKFEDEIKRKALVGQLTKGETLKVIRSQ